MTWSQERPVSQVPALWLLPFPVLWRLGEIRRKRRKRARMRRR